MLPDGSYERLKPSNGNTFNVQNWLMSTSDKNHH